MSFGKELFDSTGCDTSGQTSSNPMQRMMDRLLIGSDATKVNSQYTTDARQEDRMEDAWEVAGQQHEWVDQYQDANMEHFFETAFQDAAQQDHQLDQAWNESELDTAWQDAGENISADDHLEKLISAWKDAAKQRDEDARKYKMQETNPYMLEDDPMQIAKDKLLDGQTAEAILALEAEAQKRPDNSEAWSLLGKIHQQNDEDTKAIQALLQGKEIDPFNLDLLLQLGVSWTNEFAESEALGNLNQWLQNNPDYQMLGQGTTREELTALLEQAWMINTADPDALLALGVLYFMDRNFDMALESFTHALELNPDSHSILNKIGATMANKGLNREAVEEYSKALDTNPFYVRVWVNIGIAYANLKEYDKAARFYLCALSLNPEADHVWNYLNTAFMYMERPDLIQKIYDVRDPMVFNDEFHIVTRNELPKGNWVKEFE